MPTANKQSEDVIWYWHLMTKYRQALSLVGKRYVLDVEFMQFLIDAQNPRVIQLLNEFRNSELEKLS